MPPVTVKYASPSQFPKQVGSMPVIFTISVSGSVIVTQAVAVHKLISVTVTQYIPAGRISTKSSVV
ncbi:hypothetical protein ES703_90733 [subsurface metagenome]